MAFRYVEDLQKLKDYKTIDSTVAYMSNIFLLKGYSLFVWSNYTSKPFFSSLRKSWEWEQVHCLER